MKELTTEEKAKAYDDAIKKARQLLYIARCNKDEDRIWSLIDMFPELKESEDEKIRKELIHLVKKSCKQGGYALHQYEADRMLAWLEKQGEQNTLTSEV